MDLEISRLIFAARRSNVRINPKRRANERQVVISAADVRELLVAVNQTSSIEGNHVRHLLGGSQSQSAEKALGSQQLGRLTMSLNRLADAADRDRRIRRGQYVGPMSGSEAVKFVRGLHGI
jgi:hypothetical protein